MAKSATSIADVLATAWRERPRPTDAIPAAETDELLREVQRYQSDRLRATYGDFASQSTYARLTHFFLAELYGPYDFSVRNGRLHQLYDWLCRVTSPEQLKPMTRALALQRLSDELDAHLSAELHKLGAQTHFTIEQYQQAYRLCDNYDERQIQIELICDTFQTLHAIVRMPLTGIQVRALHGPAHALGWGSVADFLLHGYEAMKPIRDLQPFTRAVRDREMAILDEIYQRPTNPEVM